MKLKVDVNDWLTVLSSAPKPKKPEGSGWHTRREIMDRSGMTDMQSRIWLRKRDEEGCLERFQGTDGRTNMTWYRIKDQHATRT